MTPTVQKYKKNSRAHEDMKIRQIGVYVPSILFLALVLFLASAECTSGSASSGSSPSMSSVTVHSFGEIFYANTFFPVQSSDGMVFTSVKYVGKVVTYPIAVFRNFFVYWLG